MAALQGSGAGRGVARLLIGCLPRRVSPQFPQFGVVSLRKGAPPAAASQLLWRILGKPVLCAQQGARSATHVGFCRPLPRQAMSSGCSRRGVPPAVDFPEVLKALLEYSLPWAGDLKGRTGQAPPFAASLVGDARAPLPLSAWRSAARLVTPA